MTYHDERAISTDADEQGNQTTTKPWSRELLELIDRTDEFVLVATCDGVILHANTRASELLAGAVQPATVAVLFDDESMEILRAEAGAKLTRTTSWAGELKLRNQDEAEDTQRTLVANIVGHFAPGNGTP